MSSNYQKCVFLPILTIVWWGASAWNSVAAKRAAKANPYCISIMAAASNWLGLVFFVLIKLWEKRSSSSSTTTQQKGGGGGPSSNNKVTASLQELWDIRGLSAAHAIGLYASYRGLVLGRVSLVQAVKAVEPLMAMAMSALLYRQYPGDSRIVWSAVAVVAGTICVLVEDTSFAASALLWTLVSSLATQGRNQIMKQRQKAKTVNDNNYDSVSQREHGTAHSSSSPPSLSPTPSTSPAMVGLLMFISTSAAAFVMNLIMLVIQIVLAKDINSFLHDIPLPTHEVLMAGANHFAYNLASFAVLSLVEMPATHSLANTAKRAVVIGVAAWQLQEPLTSKATYGLVLVLGGSACYGYFSKMKGKAATTTSKSSTTTGWWSRVWDSEHTRQYMKQGTLLILALVLVFQTTSISNTMDNFTVKDTTPVLSISKAPAFPKFPPLPAFPVAKTEGVSNNTYGN